MNQQEILRKIGGIIVELKEQHMYLQANSSSFNDLELELFMANANFLTDHIEILKKINVNTKSIPSSLALPPEIVITAKPVIPDYFSEEEHLPFADDPLLKKLNDLTATKETEPEQVQSTEKEIPQIDSVLSAKTLEEEEPAPFIITDTSFMAQKSASTENEEVEKDFFSEPETLEPIEKEQVVFFVQESLKSEPIVFEEKPEPIVLEEKPKLIIAEPELLEATPLKPEFVNSERVKAESETPLTLNQRIAAQKGLAQPTAKAVVTNKSVQDLQSLISLNNKLLFVKELFNGYNLAYAEAINILNRYTNFEQAEQFLKANYSEKNNWKDKPATTERFLDLLRQRFA